MNIDKFWFEDPTILIKKDRLIEFFPTEKMHYKEKLNAIVRLSIYSSLIIYLNKKQSKIFLLPLFVACITLYVYKFHKLNKDNLKSENMLFFDDLIEEDNSPICQKPSKDNPFSNVLISDIQLNPNKKKACKITEPQTKEDIEELFGHNLYKDVNDVYSKNNSQRQFFSNPATTIPNNQGDFAKWLYGFSSSCKEDPSQCLKYEDVRAKRGDLGPVSQQKPLS